MPFHHRRSAALWVGGATLLATALVAAPAGAATTGDVTVSGGSASKIVLTIPDATADFGDNLTPDGDPSNASGVAANVDGSDPSTGTCYDVASAVRVKSNKIYDLSVDAAAANGDLFFLTSNPGTFSACSTGEPVDTDMFTGSGGDWVQSLGRTSGRTTDFWLGLTVLWADEPDADLADATLTLTASAHA